jgi:recombination protein RecA
LSIPVELPKTSVEREKAANAAVEQIEKTFGKGSILKLGSHEGQQVPHIPTGLPAVDSDVLGVGGVPRGRVVEFYGPESGGKTTLLLRIIASAQAAGELCAFIDAEHAFSVDWAKKNGVDVDNLLVSQPDSGEQALEIAEALIRSGAFAVVGVDSVAALVPQAELDGEMGDSHMGLQARLMSQALRKLTGIVHKTGTTLVFINQIREKIGVMFGSPETTTGGRALKFYASVRLDVRRIGIIKDGDEIIGSKVKIKGAKNKVAAPFREAEVDLLYSIGFDTKGGLFDAAVEAGVVDKSGAWFSYKGTRLGQGRVNAIKTLTADPVMFTAIQKEVIGN